MHEIWTVQKLLEFSSDYLKKNSIEYPRLESEILLAYALNTKRINLYIKYEKELSKDELAKFKAILLRRKNGEPSAYITGIKPFMSLEFTVTKDVLIPRPETEMLVESAMDILRVKDDLTILDIGTGSGAIAISIAKYAPNAKVHATDMSQKAIEVAQQNADKLGVKDRVTFEKADIFPSSMDKFDIIISNPPYIPTKNIAALPREVKDFEPLSALDGGDDGLKYYRQIFKGMNSRLNEKGILILEIDPSLLGSLTGMSQTDIFKSKVVKKDLSGSDRVLILS